MTTKEEELVNTVARALVDDVIVADDPLFPLMDKHVLAVHINSQHDLLRFSLNDGSTYCVEAAGDCCSSSWFESINDADDLHDAQVVYIASKHISAETLGLDGDEEKVYGYTIATNKGLVDIIFRNSSNGYYGGFLVLSTDSGDTCTIPVRGDWNT